MLLKKGYYSPSAKRQLEIGALRVARTTLTPPPCASTLKVSNTTINKPMLARDKQYQKNICHRKPAHTGGPDVRNNHARCSKLSHGSKSHQNGQHWVAIGSRMLV